MSIDNFKKKNLILVLTNVIIIYSCFSYISRAYSQADKTVSSLNSAADNAKSLKETSQKISSLKSDDKNSIPKSESLAPQDIKLPPPPGSFLDRLLGRVISVQINIQKDSNDNSAILSELAIIYKPEMFQKIANTSVRDWFTVNSPAVQTLRESPDILIYRFELTPELNTIQYLVDVNSKAVGAFLFTRLQNNLDTYPPYINPYKNLKLNFYYNGFDFKQNLEK